MKRVVPKLLMALTGMGVGLIIAEAACKIIDVKTSTARREATQKISRISGDPDIRYELIPGAEAQTPGQAHSVRVNNLGFRGHDIATKKPAGTFRIAVVGDSIAFGRTYADDATFPAILETLLSRDLPDRTVEVINASLSGRDTWEEAAVLERRILPLDPDLVILQICMNDHVRLPPPQGGDQFGVFGERPWHQYSSLLRLLDTRIPGFREIHVNGLKALNIDTRTPEEILKDQVVRPDQMLDVSKNWESWSQELIRIAERTRARGADILFVVFPIDIQFDRGDDHTLPQLTDLAAQHSIPLLDMLHHFRARPDRMLRDYTHPSATGHYKTAREIAVLIQAYLQSAG